ncbi:hypothetical protein CPB84DRAFT_1847284 [Gymnopilus junonius]|uniref:pyranose dehydrogenase (acceptor) n=1 Tax=Gymnopilus junonius TaxID=109634 RepID=A0A9P5TNC3_GYMJU|nr:hypothetical protein CPB84DRAFT_1847284 [Gymnopilus junonius]
MPKKGIHANLPVIEQMDLYPYAFTNESCRKSGPIQVTIPPHVHTTDKLFQEMMINMGLKPIKDPYRGNVNRTWIATSSLDPKTWTQSYSAISYLLPNIKHPNPTVLTSTLISWIIFYGSEGNENQTAMAVEFIHNYKKYRVNINKEVLLSTGSIESPHILELSGIHQPKVLSKIGVDLIVDFPGVGENMQDHTLVTIPFELLPDHESLELLLDPEYAAKAKELHARTAWFPLPASGFEGTSKLADNFEAEHAETKDPTVSPSCNLHYFENKAVKFARRMKEVEPWKSGTVKEAYPGPKCVTDDDLQEVIKDYVGTIFRALSLLYTAGSCSMLPREKRGVVDPKLKVYGMTNLRVTDISIIPLHIAAHTQAFAYVVGEKVADIIKAENMARN